MVVSFGTSSSSCSTIPCSATRTTSRGRIATPECSKLSTHQGWPNFGASRRTICPWTTTRCHGPCDTIIEWTFCARCKARDIVTSKCAIRYFYLLLESRLFLASENFREPCISWFWPLKKYLFKFHHRETLTNRYVIHYVSLWNNIPTLQR